MNEILKQAMSLGLVEKCVAAIIGILIIHGAFHLLEQTLPRRFGRADARYKVRKFVVFSGYLAILLFLAILFEDRLGRLSFALGVAGAGVAVALQDLLVQHCGRVLYRLFEAICRGRQSSDRRDARRRD